MAEFIFSTLVVLAMFLSKTFFLILENDYLNSFLGQANMLLLSFLFVVGIIDFVKNFTKRNNRKKVGKNNVDSLTFLLLILTALSVGASFYLNFIKTSLHWDAVALYDARAKFLASGLKFSEMPTLSLFDNLNKYYYLLYPPYTSIVHFFWNKTGFLSGIPVSVCYSVVLFIFVGLIFNFSKHITGKKMAALLILIVASNMSIVNVTIKEYTNLPYDLYITGGVFLFLYYLKMRRLWSFVYGVILVSTSMWIRLLEPMWIAVIIAFGLTIFSQKISNKKLVLIGGAVLSCVLEYLSWTYFTKVIGGNPPIMSVSVLGIIESFLSIFTGAPLVVFVVFAKAWGVPLLIHTTTLLASVLKFKYVFKRPEILFPTLTLFFCISLYFFEFYMLSFQVDWWRIIAKSLDRSSTFLIPISAYLLINFIWDSKKENIK